MKLIVKIVIVAAIVVFLFSGNNTIKTVREFSYEKAKEVYNFAADKVLALVEDNEKVADVLK